MHDSDVARARDDQAPVGQHLESGPGRRVVRPHQIRAAHPAAHPGAVLVDREPREHPPARRLLRLAEGRPGLLPDSFEGALDATAGPVGRDREQITLAVLPRAHQRRGEDRQHARAVAHLIDDQLDERRVDAQPRAPRRLEDDPPQVRLVGRAEENGGGAGPAAEPAVPRHEPEEVGAQHEDDPDAAVAGREHRVRDRRELRTGLEQRLLELVHDEHGRTPRQRAAQRLQASRPGVTTATPQAAEPGSPPRASAGTRPARTSEDLPAPEAPATTSNDPSTSRASSSSTSRSRPTKRSASPSS